MAQASPREEYAKTRERLDRHRENGNISSREHEAIVEFLDAHDEENLTVALDPDREHLSTNSLETYCTRLYIIAKRTEFDLMDATADDVNEFFTQMLADDVWAQNTARMRQSNLRMFYEYHDILDPEDISLAPPSDSPVTEDDVFTSDEIQRMRDACPNPRDRCLLELLIFTGQRVRAIQTLRIKDVDVEGGLFRLNPTVEGLKGADGKRSLLGARAFVEDWLEYHPASDDPDAYLICPIHTKHKENEAGSMLNGGQIRARLRKIGEAADIEKDVNPHAFRHTFVTIAKRQYGLDNDDIKWIIGHNAASRVMETTYQHLTDEDRIQSVEEQAGYREAEDAVEGLDECPNCRRGNIPSGANVCPYCGETLTIAGEETKQTVRGDVADSREMAKGRGEDEDQEAIEKLERLLSENPELLNELSE
ncbi:tyrosine-type recombinase/integrase [Halosegnis sp.]|uniref:tyrosine-type recombinase/integrase n=1 Tax=Halosegnis sp. TaxID=2864959 RepID=UPI0035D48D89